MSFSLTNFHAISALPSAIAYCWNTLSAFPFGNWWNNYFLYSFGISFFYTYKYDVVIDLTLINYFPPSTLIRPSLIIFF